MAGFANLSRRPLAYIRCPECHQPLDTSFADINMDGFAIQRCACGYSELVRSRRFPEKWRETYAKKGCGRFLLPWQKKKVATVKQWSKPTTRKHTRAQILEFKPKG